METSIEVITPQQAREILGTQQRNRNVSPKALAKLMRAINNGEWTVNGESIKIDSAGNLIDGQHRLHAIVETNTAIETVVVRGLDPGAQDTVDIGRTRSLSDILRLHGEASAPLLASMIRRQIVKERNGFPAAFATTIGDQEITPQEALLWLGKNPWIRDYLTIAFQVSTRTPLTGTSVVTLAVEFDNIDSEDATFFWDRLLDGVDLGEKDPIRILRKSFDNTSRIVSSRKQQRYIAALTIKAWNAYRDGEEVTLLVYRGGGTRREAFPVPH